MPPFAGPGLYYSGPDTREKFGCSRHPFGRELLPGVLAEATGADHELLGLNLIFCRRIQLYLCNLKGIQLWHGLFSFLG